MISTRISQTSIQTPNVYFRKGKRERIYHKFIRPWISNPSNNDVEQDRPGQDRSNGQVTNRVHT
jgi:hypothetical protein